jgi:hypothetical protein
MRKIIQTIPTLKEEILQLQDLLWHTKLQVQAKASEREKEATETAFARLEHAAFVTEEMTMLKATKDKEESENLHKLA